MLGKLIDLVAEGIGGTIDLAAKGVSKGIDLGVEHIAKKIDDGSELTSHAIDSAASSENKFTGKDVRTAVNLAVDLDSDGSDQNCGNGN